MEINPISPKLTMIFGRTKEWNKWILGWVAALLFIGGWLGDNSAVQAQSFKRVCKDGVIYYYFSNREESRAIHSYLRSNTIKTFRPPPAGKVTTRELDPVVQAASRHFNLPPSLIKAVIRVESNFVPAATSPKGAQGLMQLMPGTADQLQVSNAYDVRENIWAGTRYLCMMLEKFGYRLPLALAAYNAGPQRVQQCQAIPPIKETQGFVRDVCVNFLQYSKERGPTK
jgi:soluble lytic murein transglycosylase-like protein